MVLWCCSRTSTLLATTLLVMAGNIGLAIGDSVESILVLGFLDLGVLFYGLGTIAALSGLAAAAVAPRIVRALPVPTIFGVGAVVQSAVAALPLLALLVPSTGYVVMGAFSALWSITLTITNIAGGAYAAAAVDPASLGRTAAAPHAHDGCRADRSPRRRGAGRPRRHDRAPDCLACR